MILYLPKQIPLSEECIQDVKGRGGVNMKKNRQEERAYPIWKMARDQKTRYDRLTFSMAATLYVHHFKKDIE